MREQPKILVYGYGNPGRGDDGLGPAFVEMLEKWIEKNKLDNIHFDSNYQLNIEDAFSIRDYDIIIFADASVEDIEDFKLTRITSSDKIHFTMHAVNPAFVVDLCKKLYRKSPCTLLLHIKGYEFKLGESLSDKAEENLHKAFECAKKILSRPKMLLSAVKNRESAKRIKTKRDIKE